MKPCPSQEGQGFFLEEKNMESEIIAAFINSCGTVLAAAIGVAGVYSIFKHRSKVQRLSQQVEAYYHYESELAREIYRLQNTTELHDESLPHFRGQLRKRLAKDEFRPSMTARQAAQLRDKIL